MISNDVVQEVVGGEETPLIKKNKGSLVSIVSPKASDGQVGCPESKKSVRTKPLFPFPEGSYDQD